jgi:hypothetical protein
MDNYDISKVDIFSIPDLKRGELANIHSVLLFVYSKYHGNPLISLRYSEINWMTYYTVYKILCKLHDLKIVNVIETPTKQKPIILKLKPNHELHYMLNKNKKVEFEKYKSSNFNSDLFREAIGCQHLNEHFISKTIPSWIRNIESNSWDLYRFLTVSKIVSYFSSDHKVKTFTVNKYSNKKTPFVKTISFLYEKIPDNRKEIVYTQFRNSVEGYNLSSDLSFTNMVSSYLNEIKKGTSMYP